MMQWHHSFLGLGPGHSRRRGRQLKRAQPGAGGECPPDTPGIGFTSVLFGAAVSWRHIWMLGGCAAAPWSCAASRLSTPIGEGLVRRGRGCSPYTARSGIGFNRWGLGRGWGIASARLEAQWLCRCALELRSVAAFYADRQRLGAPRLGMLPIHGQVQDRLQLMGFGAGVSHQHSWKPDGCAATPWSCAASRLSMPIGKGFCTCRCTWHPICGWSLVNAHCGEVQGEVR